MSCNKLSLTNSTSVRWEEKGNNNAVVRTYTWGLDIRESSQGAGGVAGLLMVNAGSGGIHFPAYDLNGNVMGLVKAANGTISTRYEYGPFGEVFCSVGELAGENPFQFSTKYTDFETDLVYYGYRYYSPDLGRWISRDPIEEQGGFNLYAFVNNDPVNKFDILGLKCKPKTYPNGQYIFSVDQSFYPSGWQCETNYLTLDECGASAVVSATLECKLHVIVECLCPCLEKRKGIRYFKVENIGGSSCDTPIAENRYVSPFPLLSFKTPPSIIDLIARLIEYNISPMGLQEPNSDALKKEINSKKPKTFIEGEWLNGESPCENDSYFLENTLNFLIKLTPFYHY